MKAMLKKIGDPRIFVACCSWLIALLILGTIAQKYIGLYMAQEKYFSSWFFEWRNIPLPGGRLVLSVVFLNLSAFLSVHRWSLKKAGIFITHIGALLLLLGGFLTAHFSTEGSVVLEEGNSSNFVSDYHLLEIAIIDQSHESNDRVYAFSQDFLVEGKLLAHQEFPFAITIDRVFRNCSVLKRESTSDVTLKGMAKNFELVEEVLNKQHEQNRWGVRIQVTGVNAEINGSYILFEEMPVEHSFEVAGKPYLITLRRERRYLPFDIHLIDFQRVLHPGTGVAKSYHSDVYLVGKGRNEEKRKVRIEMNQPLREGGYTFYQASFSQSHGAEVSILAAVSNYGRLFPYISSLIMCLGLLIHLAMLIPTFLRRRRIQC